MFLSKDFLIHTERIENSWLGKINLTLLCKNTSYEIAIILAIHKLFRNRNISLFLNFKFGFHNFSSLQKSSTTRVWVLEPQVSTVMSQSMTMILVLKACSIYFTSISKFIPLLQNTDIKQKDFQLQKVCIYRTLTN